MKILVTGGCGFVGANISLFLKKKGFKVSSIDNLTRRGSLFNLELLKKSKILNYKFNINNYSKIKNLPRFDIIIDCCAEAAIEISRKEIDKVIQTNLIGTINILKKAKIDNSKIIFISTSRVYPILNINKIVKNKNLKNKLKIRKKFNETDNTSGVKSIYGVTKLSSEMFLEEFSYAFGIKYIINRCGVISGPLQFGKQDQGFVSLWIWKHINSQKLEYIGYGGHGNQIRDVLHINDLNDLIFLQVKKFGKIYNNLFTVGGSSNSYTSLRDLTKLCQNLTGNKINITKNTKTSIYDIPYFITDNNKVFRTYRWKPKRTLYDIVKETYLWMINNKEYIKKYF